MWTGVSGLINHGEKMNVVGNNIANVNTIGFKSQRMDFQDFIYQDSFSTAGLTQIGRGVKIGAVLGDFSQSSFETTNEITDLAIGGKGFFKVRVPGTERDFYTRAGDFRFSKDGYLNDPNGYTLQGWKIDNSTGPTRASGGLVPSTNTSQIKGVGVPTDIQLDKWTVDPLQTTKISFEVKLAAGSDSSSNGTNPFGSLLDNWNGTYPPANNSPYIPEDAYSGQPATIKVYDEAGGTHTLTVYFDKVSPNSYGGGSSSETVYEYVVTMDPAEDLRKVAVAKSGVIPPDRKDYNTDTDYKEAMDQFLQDPSNFDIVNMNTTKDGGLLMAGTLTFDSGGRLKTQSAYVLNGTNKPATTGTPPSMIPGNGYVLDANGNPVPFLDPENTADYYYPTEVSSSGFPMLVANFTGVEGSHTVGSVPDADKYLMEVDFGLKVSDYSDPWTNHNSLGSIKYTAPDNPMLDTALYPDATVPSHPVTIGGVSETIPAGSFTSTSASLPLASVVDNNGGTPEYYYANPDYKPGDQFSPPYIYKDKTAYLDAYNKALERAAADGRITKRPDGSFNITLTQSDWDKTGVLAANPPEVSELATIKPPAYRQDNAFRIDSSATNNTIISASQNGYGFGDLSSYLIDTSGVLSGVYSNGVTLPLYQIALYDFTCKQGLRREGNNLFSETMASGAPSSSVAGESGFGTVNAQSLENSNVDLSREFVNMITTQRGFQSNSKLITTVDTMLETVISMKR